MHISKKEFAAEERYLKRLRKQGYTESFIKSCLRGWRLVGATAKKPGG